MNLFSGSLRHWLIGWPLRRVPLPLRPDLTDLQRKVSLSHVVRLSLLLAQSTFCLRTYLKWKQIIRSVYDHELDDHRRGKQSP